MLMVLDLKSASVGLPQEFLDLLPTHCDVCASQMSISPTLTSLTCSNPRCQDKVVARLLALCETLGIKGIGEETAAAYVQEHKVVNPLQLLWHPLTLNLTDRISYPTWEKIYSQIAAKTSKGFYLWEIVQLLNIPQVQTSAEKIFDKHGTFAETFEDLRSGGVNHVQSLLGIVSEGSLSIRSISVYENLMLFEEDLLTAEQHLPLRTMRRDLDSITVVCSSKVGGEFRTKKEFYDHVGALLEGVANVSFKSSLTKGTDFLVWEGADGSPAAWTSKAVTAARWNEQEDGAISVVTSQQFIEMMKDRYDV